MLSLPALSSLQFRVNGLEQAWLVQAPLRRYQVIGWSIAAQPMDDHCRWQPLKEVAYHLDVFLKLEHPHFSCPVHPFQRRVLDNVQVMDLDRMDWQSGQSVGGGQHVIARFQGQAEDHMGAQVQAATLAALHGVEESV